MTNVLALDFLRALKKEKAAPIILEKIERDFKKVNSNSLLDLKNYLSSGLDLKSDARTFAFLVAEIFCLGLME